MGSLQINLKLAIKADQANIELIVNRYDANGINCI